MFETAAEIISAWERFDGQRSNTKTLVQQVNEYCLPRRASVTRTRTEGEDLQKELFDSTAETANSRFATGLYNFMWNPARPNFLLTPPIEDGPGAGDVARPLLAVSELVRREMGRSNFEEAFYETGLDLGAAGRATLEPSRGIESLYEFQSHPFEQVVFFENRRGRVEGVLRKFPWTARQIVEEFGRGEAAVGKSVWEAYNAEGGKGRDKSFEIVHAAVPRREFSRGVRDVRNMPIASLWAQGADKVMLRKSGWPQQRYLVCRFSKASGEKEGRSPGMTGLPDIKMVNKIEEDIIVGAEQVVRPVILVPDNSFTSKVALNGGGLLYYRSNAMHPGVKPGPFNSGARVDFGVDYAESKRTIIKQVFYNDLFLILGDEKRRTATEVRSILAEKLAMLGPSFGRMKVELFDPMIRILLSILAETPAMLRGLPLGYLELANIRYISTLAIAMEYAELSLIEDAMLFLSPLAELDPTVLDNLSFDEICRGFLEKMAWPARWIKSRGEVKALREARMAYQADQAQQMMAMQQAQLMGKTTKRPEAGSPAEAMMAEAA